jgi:hypothetical protein
VCIYAQGVVLGLAAAFVHISVIKQGHCTAWTAPTGFGAKVYQPVRLPCIDIIMADWGNVFGVVVVRSLCSSWCTSTRLPRCHGLLSLCAPMQWAAREVVCSVTLLSSGQLLLYMYGCVLARMHSWATSHKWCGIFVMNVVQTCDMGSVNLLTWPCSMQDHVEQAARAYFLING